VLPVEDDLPSVEEVVPTLEPADGDDVVLPADEKPGAGRGAKLRLLFTGQKNAPLDFTVEVLLDGRLLGKGAVHRGFSLRTETAPGNHQLELKLLLRKRLYLLQLMRPGSYEVRLTYDPLWNNFADRIDVKFLP
jgi:hypothetical protein